MTARRPACTGITATYCPVHGDCTCPRPTDTGYEPITYLNAGGCPLHDPSSDHAEAPAEVEVLRRALATTTAALHVALHGSDEEQDVRAGCEAALAAANRILGTDPCSC